jgi:hypothetical protein
MLTEAVLNEVVKSLLGTGFSQVVKAAFSGRSGQSEREILAHVVHELRQHGGQINNLDARLAHLEQVLEMLVSRVSAPQTITVVMSGEGALSAPAATKYCRQCGMVPGNAERCVGPLGDHQWRKIESVYCKRCGLVPGERKRCPGPIGHEWRPMEAVYCTTCGATPGKSKNCGPIGHYWKPL